jgi:hypothetical protein
MSNKENSGTETKPTFAFSRMNYTLMLIGLGVIILGYILMIGGGSDDPNVFSEDLFNFQRITLSPLLILGGFVIEIVAILHRPKTKGSHEE